MTQQPVPALTYRRVWIALGTLLVVAICILSLMPRPPQIGVPGEDKVFHILTYGVLMLWWSQILRPFKYRLGMATAFVTMGVVIEFLQGWSGWRSFDPQDMVANAFGVALGWFLFHTPAGALLARVDRALLR